MLEQQSQLDLQRQQMEAAQETQRVQQEAQTQIQATQAQLQKAQLEAQKARMDAQQAKQEVQMERQRAKLEQEGQHLEALINTPPPSGDPVETHVSPAFAERLGRLEGHLDKLVAKRARIKQANTAAPEVPAPPSNPALERAREANRLHTIDPKLQVGSERYNQFIADKALKSHGMGENHPGALFHGENSRQYFQDYQDARNNLAAPNSTDPWEKWKATGQMPTVNDIQDPRWTDRLSLNPVTGWALNHFRPAIVGGENAGQSWGEGNRLKAVGQYAGGVGHSAARLGLTAYTASGLGAAGKWLGAKALGTGAAKATASSAAPAAGSRLGRFAKGTAKTTGILGAYNLEPKIPVTSHSATENLANTAQGALDVRERAQQFQDRMQQFRDTTGIQHPTMFGANPSLHTINRMGSMFPQYSTQTPDYGGGWKQMLMELLAQWFGPRYNPQYPV